MAKSYYINGVPQRWEDFNRRYMDGTDAIYNMSSLSAAEKAAKYGFVVEKTGTHVPSAAANNIPSQGNSFIEQIMKNFDPQRYATDTTYRQTMDQIIQTAVEMRSVETPSSHQLRPNTSQPDF